MRWITFAIVAIAIPATTSAQAPGDIRIEVRHGDATDFSLTPVWFGFHDGTFDSFDVGSTASSSLEALAELGDVSGVSDDFTNAPDIPGDFQGAIAAAGNGVGPIEQGETGVTFVTPANPSAYPYFSFLSMLVPTNDTFIGNDDPLAYEVFNSSSELIDENGQPTDARIIQVFGSDLYDAGTEVNQDFGAAFTQGEIGTEGDDEGGLIALGSDLSPFLGNTDVTGRVINDTIGSGELLATIRISTVVPEPSAALLTFLAGLAGVVRRRA